MTARRHRAYWRGIGLGLCGWAMLLLSSQPAHAQERCGIAETIFRNGFEADSLPGPLIFPPSAPLTLTLDSGQNGSTVPGPTTTLSGTFSGPPGTGVGAKGRPALRSGNRWLIPNVPLDGGPEVLTVTATTLAGATTTQSLTLIRDDSVDASARLSVDTTSRFAPGTVRFRLVVAPSLVVTRLRLDFDGDGIADLDSSNPAAPLSYRYRQPGLYRVAATIDLQPGSPGTPPNTITRETQVLVQLLAETREDVCAAFGTMRTRLTANDVSGALLALHPRLRPTFQALWTDLGSGLPAVAAQLGTIVDGTIGTEGFAEYLIVRPISGQPQQYRGYRVHFDLGSDGVWRIGSM